MNQGRPFNKRGLGSLAYAALSCAVFFLPHVFALALQSSTPGYESPPFWLALISPLRIVGYASAQHEHALLAGVFVLVSVNAMLAALAFKRIQSTGDGVWLATLSIVPVVQIGVIVWLSITRSSEPSLSEGELLRRERAARNVLLGVGAGLSLSIAAVAATAFVTKSYGYSLFVATPFVVGLITAYLVNRQEQRTVGETLRLVLASLLLGALALLALALEGAICLILASPLIAGIGAIGAIVGRSLADIRRAPPAALGCVAFLPLLMLGEAFVPPRAHFQSVESVVVNAAPEDVWRAITHMGEINEPPKAPFGWGLAYPVRGDIDGEGVGAIRRGEFSTGTAFERVTIWTPNVRLRFDVLSNPPMLRELSPYAHVHAPHMTSAFRTLDADFSITPLANGQTRLTLATHHELQLEPGLYWVSIAQWAVRTNKERVLHHFRRLAEAGARH